jgi:hypothetical protein
MEPEGVWSVIQCLTVRRWHGWTSRRYKRVQTGDHRVGAIPGRRFGSLDLVSANEVRKRTEQFRKASLEEKTDAK